jgi:hypothetical protein
LLVTDDEARIVFALHLDEGQRLIYRRRVRKSVGGGEFVVYLVGWQKTIANHNVQSISYIAESGEVHMAGAWRDDHPWFYSVAPVPCEE